MELDKDEMTIMISVQFATIKIYIYSCVKTYPLARLSFISPPLPFVSNNTFVPLEELDNLLDEEKVEGAELRTKLNASASV